MHNCPQRRRPVHPFWPMASVSFRCLLRYLFNLEKEKWCCSSSVEFSFSLQTTVCLSKELIIFEIVLLNVHTSDEVCCDWKQVEITWNSFCETKREFFIINGHLCHILCLPPLSLSFSVFNFLFCSPKSLKWGQTTFFSHVLIRNCRPWKNYVNVYSYHSPSL